MLIGQDRAGKTSLKKSFLGLPFDPYEQSTDGIEVDPSKFEIDVDQVKNWQRTDEKLSVSQFANDLAKIVAAQIGEDETSVNPGAQDEPKEMTYQNNESGSTAAKEDESMEKKSQMNQDPIRDGTTPKFAKVQRAKRHNEKAAKESALNFDPTLPPEEFTDLLVQHLKGLNLPSDSTSAKNHMTLDLWDFAGQHLFYASYPVFLSSRAVYMLVYNLSKGLRNIAEPCARQGVNNILLTNPNGETNLENLLTWLVSVRTMCSAKPNLVNDRKEADKEPYLRPPVFVVGTHADKPFQDIKIMEQLIQTVLSRKDFDGLVIRPFFSIDNTQGSLGAGVRALQEKLIEVLQQEPYMGEEVPLRWFNFEKVIKALIAKKTYYLNLEQLQTIIQEVCFISNENEIATMLDFYHDLGIIVKHHNTVVLQAQWLIDVFKQLITIRPYNDMESRHSKLWRNMEETGVLSMQLVEHVFSKYCQQGLPNEDILNMMEHFGLLVKFARSPSDIHYFVPAQLKTPPKALRKMEPSSSDPCPLYLHFLEGFVPYGLFFQLVSRCSRWCLANGFTQPPRFYEGASTFFLEKTCRYQLTLLCKKRFIKIVLKHQRTRDEQLPLTEEEEVASLVRRFLEDELGNMRQELPWLNNLKYELCVECPCCPEEEIKCANHGQVSCAYEDCMSLVKVMSGGCLSCCFQCCQTVNLPRLEKWFSVKESQANTSLKRGMIHKRKRDAEDTGTSGDDLPGHTPISCKSKRGLSHRTYENSKWKKRVEDSAKQSLRDVEQLQRYPRNTTRMTDVSRRLDEIASDKGFTVSDNEGSGNCMFYSLSEQLDLVKGIQISQNELRQHIVQYLEKNPTLSDGTNLFNFVHGYQSWSDYLTKMSADGTWGDHVILHAVASCYKTSIHVISSLSPNHDVTISPEQKRDVDSSNRLVLGHLHEHHYVSLRPKPGLVKKGCPSDDELERLSMNLEEWRPLGRRLAFNNAQLTGFDKDAELWREKAFTMLMAWKRREGKSATYRVLYEALRHEFVNRKDLAEKFCCHSD